MKKFCFLWLAALACLWGRAAEAGGGVGAATEHTQLLNNAELATQVEQMYESLDNEITQITHQVTQITNQMTMISDMVHNTMGLPSRLMGQVTGAASQLIGVYNQTNGLLQNLSNLDDEFYNKFYSTADAVEQGAGYGWSTNFAEEYHNLSVAMEEKAEEIAESLGVTADDITDSSELLGQLAENASSAEGRNAILHAGNEMLGFLGTELTKTRALLAEQTKTYLTYAERERTLEEAEAKAFADSVKHDLTWKENDHVPVTYGW